MFLRFFLCLMITGTVACEQARCQDESELRNINPRIVSLFPPMDIEEERVAANGIRKINGRHLVLYTDIRDREEVDELVEVFDLAVPIWQQYFSIDPQRLRNWKIRAFLIADRNRFRQAGLIPADLPDFLAGYQRGSGIWIYDQPGKYYVRHLLLHEGTHAVMEWFLNGVGSPWYSEGMAELLGLHQWDGNQLRLNYKVKDRSESPYWGRIKIIRRELKGGQTRTLNEVLNIPNPAFRQVESYAWAWAACEFLSYHAISQDKFRNLIGQVELSPERFNLTVRKLLQANWENLERDWQLFLGDMDYGYNVAKSRLVSAESVKIDSKTSRIKIRSDHSWQNSSIQVRPGEVYRITCDTRFQVGRTSKPWPCEANGITLEYFKDRPLGMLMTGILNPEAASASQSVKGLMDAIGVGKAADISIQQSGFLCFRINEFPGKLLDNQGVLEVVVEKLK